MKLESKFQAELVKDLKHLFPGCVVLKNDSSYQQGIPDLIILYKDRWAMLECKQHAKAKTQPNQPYYVDVLDDMSYAAFIYPENKGAILEELQSALRVTRQTRRS